MVEPSSGSRSRELSRVFLVPAPNLTVDLIAVKNAVFLPLYWRDAATSQCFAGLNFSQGI